MTPTHRARWFLLGAGLAALAALVGAFAVRADVTPGTINACVPTGTAAPTMLFSASGSCARGQQLLTWNIQGPAGPPGSSGSGAATPETVLVTKTSPSNTNRTRTAVALCPGTATALYGGADLTGDPFGKVIFSNRATAFSLSPGATTPNAWIVKAQARYDDEAQERLKTLAVAINRLIQTEFRALDRIEVTTEFWGATNYGASAEGNLHFGIPIPQNFKIAANIALAAAKAEVPKKWGVTAWVVCAKH